ncbi:MAG: acyl-ACP thioesterase domain-containing protein [Symbiobacterium sp.]|uniref:acyl-[acyl-carrier-protein] thioesterase n=1 Tax=Symbiobacterium sp. TaxID=1971213 RepID=UPI00346419CB
MIFEQRFIAGIRDVGDRNELTNKAILEALTDVSNLHGLTVGQSTRDRSRSHLAWMVANWKLKVIRRPKVCDTFVARTWARGYSRAHALRDYELVDQNGEVCALATSKWVAVDTETGSLLRLTPELMDRYEPEPDRVNFPGVDFMRAAPKDVPEERRALVQAPRYMIDLNGHVHNTMYLDLAAEVLPDDLWRRQFDSLEIHYRKEILPGQTVLLLYGEAGGTHYVQLKSEDGAVLHAVIALSD